MPAAEDRDYQPPEYKPDILLLISGKRKCGKDYITDLLLKRLESEKTAVMRIAEPIKHYWAEKHSLDFEKLLDTSEYKEQHRFGMVKWSMEVRSKNYGYFNTEAIRMAGGVGKPIWICVDCRHKADYKWFQEHYSDRLKRVRITADEEIRKNRKWVYTTGVDDGPSECDLDDVKDWDLMVTNNGENPEEIESAIQTIFNWVSSATTTKN